MTIKKTNMILNAGLCFGLLAVLCSFALFAKAAHHIEKTIEDKNICLSLGNELRESSKNLTRYVRMYAASGDKRFEDAYNAVLDERSGKIPRARDREYFAGEKHALLDLLRRYGITSEEMGYIETANRLSEDLVPLEQEAINAVKGIFKDDKGNYAIKGQPDREKAIALVYGGKYEELTAPIMRNMDRFAQTLSLRMNTVVKNAQREEWLDMLIFFGSVGLMLIIIAISIIYSFRSIIKPLIETEHFSMDLASGNFDKRIQIGTRNEIGQLRESLNSMANQINDFIGKAREEAEHAREESARAKAATEQAMSAQSEANRKTQTMLDVADRLQTAGNKIFDATSQLSTQLDQSDHNASLTAQRLSQVASAMQQMNITVRDVAKNAGVASVASMQTREKAQQGSQIVEQSLQSIDRVSQISEQLKQDMSELNEHAHGIGQVISVIMDIADQTNLLALNAAIEAARAGESGRGFAVVADEVRKLAEKTTSSTTDVRNIITAIQTSTSKSSGIVENAAEEIKQANSLAAESGKALREIVSTVDKVSGQIEAIAAASEEQSATSDQINNSLAEVNDMGGATAEAMHQAAGVVSGLTTQAEELKGMIGDLKQK